MTDDSPNPLVAIIHDFPRPLHSLTLFCLFSDEKSRLRGRTLETKSDVTGVIGTRTTRRAHLHSNACKKQREWVIPDRRIS
jgi:hypothetical protein